MSLTKIAEDIRVINETGRRRTTQCFHKLTKADRQSIASNEAFLKHIYAKSFMKYDYKVLGDQKNQFFVLYGELEILKSKALELKTFFQKEPPGLTGKI